MEFAELIGLYNQVKEYGIFGIFCLVLLKYGGAVLTFVLERFNVKLTRRQTVEDQVASLSGEIAQLRGNLQNIRDKVADAATAMDEEMQASHIENRVLRVFVERLKNIGQSGAVAASAPPLL